MVSAYSSVSRSRCTVPVAALLWASAATATPANDYPTTARVEYVQECMYRGGHDADLYKCSCVIDWLAERLTYDQFVEAATFARYSSLGGEGGGIFRDTPQARALAKQYRTLEADGYRHCGLGVPP